MTQLTYTAAVLTKPSRKRLLEAVPALHARVLADHVTLTLEPSEEELATFEEGAVVKFQVTARASNGAVQAVTVRGLDSQKEHPHVTVSVAEGHSARESDDLLREAKPRMLKSFVLEGVLKVFRH
jgi:uncharacterized protein YggU (UPF0235/DUF167 family)